MESINLEISTFQKFKTIPIDWHTLKLVLLTMPVQKYGGMNPMTPNLIFGLLVVLFMRCVQGNLHLREKILTPFIEMFKEESMKGFL